MTPPVRDRGTAVARECRRTGSRDPATALSEVIDASPGDHVTVHLVQQARKRTNMYGVFAERPIDLDVDDLAEVRREMGASFGTGGHA